MTDNNRQLRECNEAIFSSKLAELAFKKEKQLLLTWSCMKPQSKAVGHVARP